MSEHTTYKSFWNEKASTERGAFEAVDGSGDEEVVRTTGALSARQVSAALELTAQDRVLELGCGVARIGRELAPNVAFWHGVDISDNMAAKARERLSEFKNTAVDVLTRTQLEMLPDASFDKAYCVAVFIHMDKEDFFLYLTELFRVLKPGGRIYFDCWNIAHPIGWRRFAYEVADHSRLLAGGKRDVARNQFCTPQEVSIYLKQAGFETALLLDDSPQIQAMAQKPGGEDVRIVGERLAMEQGTIAYSPRWARLFAQLLKVIYEGEHPGKLYAELEPDAAQLEVSVYRAWLRAFWRNGEAQWGAAPKN